MKKDICFMLGTRGNYGKSKTVMEGLNKTDVFNVQIMLAGPTATDRYGDFRQILESDGFVINREVQYLLDGDTDVLIGCSTGLAVYEFVKALDELDPWAVYIVGDRFEALALAIAAVSLNKIIIHLEGGEVSGSTDERFRHAITKLAHIHLVASKEAYKRVIQMGECMSSVYQVGSPSFDLMIDDKREAKRLLNCFCNTDSLVNRASLDRDFLVVSLHPVVIEYGEALNQVKILIEALKQVRHDIFWILPNIDAGQSSIWTEVLKNGVGNFRNITVVSALPTNLYLELLSRSRCLVGNSSSGIRECEFLGVRSINIGARQRGRLRGLNVVDVEWNVQQIVQAIEAQIKGKKLRSQYLYGDGSAGSKIIDVLKNLDVLSIDKRFFDVEFLRNDL
jgi:UDP-hydrolysing UDP-N-acetyl-D-glucosamine 2-epimerase